MNDKQIINTMIEYGGSFVRKLGAAAYVADKENLAKIKSTWPDYWAQYQRMGALRFYALYLWYQMRHGYEKNPMEIEARQVSGHR